MGSSRHGARRHRRSTTPRRLTIETYWADRIFVEEHGHSDTLASWEAFYDQRAAAAQVAYAAELAALETHTAAMVAIAAAANTSIAGNTAGGGTADYGGGRALGGPVTPGQFYMVGERGPEFFTPGQSGNITPAAAAPVINLSPRFVVEVGKRDVTRVFVEDGPRDVRRLVGH